MKMDFTYSLRESAPEFRFAELRLSVPAQIFHEHGAFGIAPARLDGGICFTIRCSLVECGKFILKRVCSLCITVSGLIRKVVRFVRETFDRFYRMQFSEKQTTYLSCCVFRC